MFYTNRLLPFLPEWRLRFVVRPAAEVVFAEDESTEAEFGFEPRSKQARFFDAPTRRHVVGLLYEGDGDPPRRMTDVRVVARVFGTLDRDGSLEVWHLSVRRTHRLNNSDHGRNWGVHNVASETRGSRTRWRTADSASLTPTNAEAHVRGTPNPYAVECLVRVVDELACPSVRQHDAMPCARLFDKGYDHRTHPATLLIYRALHFVRGSGVLHYAWVRGSMPSLATSHAAMRECMHYGVAAV